MDCRRFEENLERLLTGELAAEEADRAAAHYATCARCARLLDIVRGDHVHDVPNDESFVAALLRKTAGSSCARATANLCAWVDGELDATEADLVQLHVAHCADCAEVTAALHAMAADLAGMAEIDPGPAFTRDAVDRARAALHRPAWAARWREEWQKLLLRPRASMELATAGCLLLVLLCGLPFSPMRQMPRQALQVAQINPVAAVVASATRLEPAWRDYGLPVWEHSGAPLADHVGAAVDRFVASRPQAAVAWNDVSTHASAAAHAVWRRDGAQLSQAVHALGHDFESLRDGLIGAPADSLQADPRKSEE